VVDDPNYKATLIILNDIEEKGLVQFNERYLDEGYFKNFLKFEKAFFTSVNEISKIDSFQTNEMVIFVIYCELSFINSHLDAMNSFLKIITNPTKIKGGFDENTPLHTMIRKICNKMQYSEKLKNSIRGLFLHDFREAVEHQKFVISSSHLTLYPKESIEKHLDIIDLTDYSLQVMTILEAMLDWSDGRQKKTKPKTIDAMLEEMVKQVQMLSSKLDRLA